MGVFEQTRAARLWLERYGPWLRVPPPPARRKRPPAALAPARPEARRPAPEARGPGPDARAGRDAPRPVPEAPATRAPTAAARAAPSRARGPLDALQAEFEICLRCRRSRQRTMVVFGAGFRDADLMFVGIAPSAEDDLAGAPFTGEAGALLERMVEGGMELPFESVYRTTLLRCHAEGPARPDELEACRGLLDAELEAVRPRLLCLLGPAAANALLGGERELDAWRGRWHSHGDLPVRVTYDPAALLALGPREARAHKRAAWEDLKAVLGRLRERCGGHLLPW